MDLNLLRQAIKPLSDFAQDEITFDAAGTTVTLRPLLPREEIACQKTAADIITQAREDEEELAEGELTRATAINYFDRFRAEVISYALVQVGDTSFRGIPLVETGEVLEGGVKKKVTLQQALRTLILESWSRAMITICFSKYGDLMARLARKASDAVGDNFADLDAEIKRVEDRLAELKAERAERAEGDSNVTMDQVEMLVKLGDAIEEEIQESLEQVEEASRADEEAAQRLAQAMSEEAEEAPSPPVAEVSPVKEGARREPVTPKTAPPPTTKPTPPPVQDPIKAAQQAAELEGLAGAKQAGFITTPDGQQIPAFRLPSATISGRGQGDPAPAEKPKKPDPTVNPHFKKR